MPTAAIPAATVAITHFRRPASRPARTRTTTPTIIRRTTTAPRPRRGKQGQQAEAAGQGPEDGPHRVPTARQPDLLADVLVTLTQQANQQRELHSADKGRGQDDDRCDQGPARGFAEETRRAGLTERGGQHRQAIAQGQGDREAAGLQDAREGQPMERDRQAAGKDGIGGPAQPDARQGHGKDQAEREGGAAEDRPEHAVPNEFHEKEGEACHAGHGIDEVRRQRRRGRLVVGGASLRLPLLSASSAPWTPDRRAGRVTCQRQRGQCRTRVDQTCQPERFPRAE